MGGRHGPGTVRRVGQLPALHEAFDLLVGAGRWQSRYSVGSFPLRFPHATEPDDAGWHIEGSYAAEGAEHEWPYTNLVSRGRALLMLMLYSEVTEEDAPTRIRVGSHLDVPRVLAPYGEKGASSLALGPQVAEASAGRPHTRHRQARRRLPLPPLPGPRGPAAPRHPPPLHGPTTPDAGSAIRVGPPRRHLFAGGVSNALRPVEQGLTPRPLSYSGGYAFAISC